MLLNLLSSLRIATLTLAICAGGYTTLVWAFAQGARPFTANGSILRDAAGAAVGSRQIAQGFTQAGYFWPRPSAADYDGMAAAGSNLSPAGADVRARAEETVARYGATSQAPLPADLATASGGGLDPHISEAAALYQVPRVAGARGRDAAAVQALVRSLAQAPGGPLTAGRIVNVLDLNRAIDNM
ncbi:potassium-transporting ATPase subunit C [Falsirhodobacter halotolerans]|uniref:potassium-transporting ATPase subunit C n=1 Tax=Falsirhodobacter halotolerans TaxID=1146892 RepID=UPI001FD14CB1|nr:potassium-transporting ATPase subunit C [Falsirhodobacter halotolerans]MCJ8140360.1 potassium-transporting ATPase subunit C [Falsirhodobacter halotolerans]